MDPSHYLLLAKSNCCVFSVRTKSPRKMTYYTENKTIALDSIINASKTASVV